MEEVSEALQRAINDLEISAPPLIPLFSKPRLPPYSEIDPRLMVESHYMTSSLESNIGSESEMILPDNGHGNVERKPFRSWEEMTIAEINKIYEEYKAMLTEDAGVKDPEIGEPIQSPEERESPENLRLKDLTVILEEMNKTILYQCIITSDEEEVDFELYTYSLRSVKTSLENLRERREDIEDVKELERLVEEIKVLEELINNQEKILTYMEWARKLKMDLMTSCPVDRVFAWIDSKNEWTSREVVFKSTLKKVKATMEETGHGEWVVKQPSQRELEIEFGDRFQDLLTGSNPQVLKMLKAELRRELLLGYEDIVDVAITDRERVG